MPTTTRTSVAATFGVPAGDAEPGDGRGEEPPQRDPLREAPQGVTVIDATGAVAAREREWLASHGSAALRILGAVGAVRVRLVNDHEMARAHEAYLGVPGTTDVITFDMADGASASGGVLDVDLLVCVDEARRQAQARGIDPVREMLLYTVHGVLHALGHDDHDEASAAAMHAREDEVLTSLGVGVTFGLASSAGTSVRGSDA